MCEDAKGEERRERTKGKRWSSRRRECTRTFRQVSCGPRETEGARLEKGDWLGWIEGVDR